MTVKRDKKRWKPWVTKLWNYCECNEKKMITIDSTKPNFSKY